MGSRSIRDTELPAHIAALKEFGPTPIHRRTFITKFV